MYLTRLANLKSLNLNCCYYKYSINEILRTLSDNGVIEELTICHGVFQDEGGNAPPLVFNKLQSFCWFSPESTSSIIAAVKNSQMSAIQTLELNTNTNLQSHMYDDLLKIIESKTTLKSIRLQGYLTPPRYFVPNEFFRRVIDILKKPCWPKRQFLKLRIGSHHPEVSEEVRKITFEPKYNNQ